MQDLENEKNKVQREFQKVEEQVEKRLGRIERLNELATKTSIKNTVLGKDADRNEYWFFKEEPGKLFVKKMEHKAEGSMEESKTSVPVWYFYDEEGQFDKLIEACNIKGIRERKLQENLKKLRDRMKLKKSRKPKVVPEASHELANGQQTISSMLKPVVENSATDKNEESKIFPEAQ